MLVVKTVVDAYTALGANIRLGNLGREKSRRRINAESKAIAFGVHAAQPFDDRRLSWQIDALTVNIRDRARRAWVLVNVPLPAVA